MPLQRLNCMNCTASKYIGDSNNNVQKNKHSGIAIGLTEYSYGEDVGFTD